MNELLRLILFLPPQASTVARDIDTLHYSVISVTIAGAFAVTLTGGYFLVRYRRPSPERATPAIAVWKPPVWAEVGVIAGLFLLFVAWWWVGFRQFVMLRVSPEEAMPVYVTAQQWMWKFAYPDGQRSIATLYVPAGRPIKLVLSSRDVIHSFFVPDFRIKQDVLPGRYTTVWFEAVAEGRHEILCTEYCGTNHSTMRGEVIALSPADFGRWTSAEEPAEMVGLGEKVAARQGCLRCHTLDGTPHIGPTFANLYGSRIRLDNGRTIQVDDGYLSESMMDPMAKRRAEFAPVMPSYRGRITPLEVAALLELIRSIPGKGVE